MIRALLLGAIAAAITYCSGIGAAANAPTSCAPASSFSQAF